MVKRRFKIRRHRRFLARHRFMLYLEAGLFWVVCVAGLFYAISFLIIPSIAETRLEKMCGGIVNIESGRFAGFGGLRLRGLVVTADTEMPSDVPVLQADRVDIRFNTWKLLTGRWRTRSVDLYDLLLTADFDIQQRRWNLRDLSFRNKSSRRRQEIPRITVNRAALRFRKITKDGPRILSTVGLEARIAPTSRRNEYGFTVQTDGRFGYGASQLQGGFQIGKKNEQNRFWAAGNIHLPAHGVLENRWEVQDISVNGAWDENAVTVSDSVFTMGTGTGRLSGQLTYGQDWPMDIDVFLKDFQLSEEAVVNTFVYGRLYDLLGSGANHFFQGYHPAGTGSIGSENQMFNIKASVRDLSEADCNGTIYCSDITIRDRRFPYTLENLTGEIEVKGKALALKQLTARHGEVDVVIDGTVETREPNSLIDIRITSPNMQLDYDLFVALPSSVKGFFHGHRSFPTGKTGVDYRFGQSSDGQERMDLVLDLKGVDLFSSRIGYPLENLSGKIIVDSNSLKIDRLTTSYPDDRRIQMNGEVFDLGQPDPDYRIEVMAKAIPVDSNLINALPQLQQSIFEDLKTDAVVDANIVVTGDSTNQQGLNITVNMDVQAETLLYKPLPLPLTDVTLRATSNPEGFWLQHLQARAPGGQINLRAGRLYAKGQDPERPGYRVGIQIEDFALTPEFWKAVVADPNRIPSKFQVSGPVDVNGYLEVNSPLEQDKGTDLFIRCKDNRLTASGKELAQLQGDLRVRGQTVEFHGFDVNDLVLESVPVERMNDRAKLLYKSASPEGRADIRIQEGRIQLDQDRIAQVELCAEMDMKNISCGDAVKQLDGTCQVELFIDEDSKQLQTQTLYQIESVHYRNLVAKKLSGSLIYDPNLMQFKSEDLQAVFYDGQIQGTCRVNVNPRIPVGFELDLEYNDVDVPQFLAANSRETPEPAGRGKAQGSLGLGGTFDNLDAFQGDLTMIIQDLKIGRQSLLGKILTAVQLRRPENFVFSEIELRADIQNPILVFDRIRMIGQPLVFEGTGQVNLKSRMINMQLAAWDRIVTDRETILGKLTRGMSSALFSVDVDGSLDDPDVKAVILNLFERSLDVFKKEGIK